MKEMREDWAYKRTKSVRVEVIERLWETGCTPRTWLRTSVSKPIPSRSCWSSVPGRMVITFSRCQSAGQWKPMESRCFVSDIDFNDYAFSAGHLTSYFVKNTNYYISYFFTCQRFITHYLVTPFFKNWVSSKFGINSNILRDSRIQTSYLKQIEIYATNMGSIWSHLLYIFFCVNRIPMSRMVCIANWAPFSRTKFL